MAQTEIRAVFFDFDGTLTSPGALDFLKIKQAMGCPEEMPILEFIDSLETAAEQNQARRVLETFETQAAAVSRPCRGCERLLRSLKTRHLQIGIITRNSRQSIARALDNFDGIGIDDFDIIISRDSPAAIKPSPEGVLLAARELGLPPERTIMVGDYIFDLRAGRAAGACTVLIDAGGGRERWAGEYDFAIETLDELPGIIDLGIPLPAGKLPNRFLEECIGTLTIADPAVLIGPGVGEDTAAMDIAGREVLVLKSDPITFIAADIGYYAVIINANDIATSGAKPRWLLATLLFPPGTSALQVHRVMLQIQAVCRNLGIVLCGGHTEITDAVTRPVVTGALAGLVSRSNLLSKANLRAGDRILMTKRVAVEGTAILAVEFREQLVKLGIAPDTLRACADLATCLSILPEAELAAGHIGTAAMHDVTEGGLATALFELSCASGYRLKVEMDHIPVFEHTRALCGVLDLNPLGLIGSGSLLIACRPQHQADLVRRIKNAAIEVTCIGEVIEKGRGIAARAGGRPVPWPDFAVDELARLYSLAEAKTKPAAI